MGFSTYKNNISTVGGSSVTPNYVTGSSAIAINNNFINIADLFSSFSTGFRSLTTSTTIVATDYKLFFNTTPSSIAQTLPNGTSGGLNLVAGKEFVIKNIGSNVLTVLASGVQTIDGSSAISLYQYDSVTLTWDGSNWGVN